MYLIYVDKSGSINSSLNSCYLWGVSLGGGETDYQIFKEMFSYFFWSMYYIYN